MEQRIFGADRFENEVIRLERAGTNSREFAEKVARAAANIVAGCPLEERGRAQNHYAHRITELVSNHTRSPERVPAVNAAWEIYETALAGT